MKRFLALILAVIMVMAMIPTVSATTDSVIDAAIDSLRKNLKTAVGDNRMDKQTYLQFIRDHMPAGTDVKVEYASASMFGLKEATATEEGKLTGQFVFSREVKVHGKSKPQIHDRTDYISVKIPVLGYDNQPTFVDVPADAWYAEPVKWAVGENITNGTSETTFSPDKTCTIAEILTFLYRANGSIGSKIYNPYLDVAETDWFYEPARWAFYHQIYTGELGNFGGNNPCTRAQVVTFLWKLAGSPTDYKNVLFTDVPDNADYTMAVYWAVRNGITTGTSDTTFSPDATCTRGQIVTFLYRMYAK